MEKIEENAIVLDYMPEGRGGRPPFTKEPMAQVIGTNYFTLLEVVPKKDEAGTYIKLEPHSEVYIGRGEREKVHFIKRRIEYSSLTPVAEAEVEIIVRKVVEEQAQRFVDFFNKAQPITTRQHQLELLPKVGKKLMWEILSERNKKPFDSFDNIKLRVKNMPNPEEVRVERILEELKGLTKRYIFTATPPSEIQEAGMGQGRRPYSRPSYHRTGGGYQRQGGGGQRRPGGAGTDGGRPSGGARERRLP